MMVKTIFEGDTREQIRQSVELLAALTSEQIFGSKSGALMPMSLASSSLTPCRTRFQPAG
jgi:hypothetical protein